MKNKTVKNQTCEYKYKIGCTVYCEIRHNDCAPCTEVVYRCKEAKPIDCRKTPQMYYSFKDKRLKESIKQ